MTHPDNDATHIEKQFPSIFNDIPVPMFLTDRERGIILVNSRFERITGFTASELIRMHLEQIVADFDPAVFEKAIAEIEHKQNSWVKTTVDLIRKDRRIVKKDLILTKAAGGIPGSFLSLVVSSDLHNSEKYARLKERAEAALKTKSEFLAKMSHEIRTPIHSIVGITELLSETKLDDEQKEYIERIMFSADSLMSIINDILDFSKIEAGKITQEIMEFDLHADIEKAVEMLTIEAHKKGLEILLYIGTKVPRKVLGDSAHLRQILVNLISNAIKFTHSGEILVSVSVSSEDARSIILQFSVRDTGVGIEKGQALKLFSAFTQADNSTSRKYGGTGLGLAISKGLVALLGGRIGLRSSKGKGSEFRFTAVFEKLPGFPPEKEVTRDLFGDQKLLIVSENRTLRAIIKQYAADMIGEIEEAENGADALGRLLKAAQGQGVHNICIIDLRLPDMDGWQLASKINADKSINMSKLMLLTTKDKGSGEAKMKALGWFNSYIGKPVKKRELIASLVKLTNTEFDLTPVDNETSSVSAESNAGPANEFAGKDVLVVEDNEINSQLFKIVLENLGINAYLALDGMEAVKSVRIRSFDMIFMDIQMPNMNGYDASKTIRKEGVGTPIIAVTANALKSEVEKALSSGMNDYITKPFKKQDLIPVLRKWLIRDCGESASVDNPEARESVVSGVFDAAKALENFLGNKTLLFDLIGKFIIKVEGQIESIDDAFVRSDFDTIFAEVHSIKGAALNLTAERLGEAACSLESAAVRKDNTKTGEYINELRNTFREFGDKIAEVKKIDDL
jgi:two-component system sensor histidine kinase/response regulator